MGISNPYIHDRMNQIQYFNLSHDRKKGYVFKTARDIRISEIQDSRLTKKNIESCNLVISSFWFIRTTPLFLH